MRLPKPNNLSVRCVAFPGGLITVRRTGALNMESVVRRWHNDRRLLRLGTPALVHGLLDVVVDGYFETVQELDDAIEELEDDLFFFPASHSQKFQRHASSSGSTIECDHVLFVERANEL